MIAGDEVIVFGNDSHKTHVTKDGNLTKTYTSAEHTTFDSSTNNYYIKSDDVSDPTYTLVKDPKAGSLSSYYIMSYEGTGFTGDYSDDIYIRNGTRYTRLDDGATLDDGTTSALTSSKEYLGTLNSTDKTTLEVTFVAWYEGTDSVVVNGNTKDLVSATLGFYSRNIE